MVGAWRAADGQLTPELGRALFETSYVLGYNGAGVGIGILLLATTTVALRARALMPRWLALLLGVAGLAFLTPLSRYLLAPSILLLVVASVQLLRNEGARRVTGACLTSPTSTVSVPSMPASRWPGTVQ